MTRDDVTRWEVEIQSWRERYEALVKAMADSAAMLPPRLLADKESYELGRLHGAAAEREQCHDLCCRFAARDMHPAECAAAIRARSNA